MSDQEQLTAIGKSARNRIHNITGTQVQSLIAKLDKIKPFLPSTLPLQQNVSENDYMTGEVNGGGGKHVLQECSIIGNLRRIGAFDVDLVSQPMIALEVGAGTGRLSERLQRVSNNEMTHVLVDRQDFAPSQCRDGKMRQRSGHVSSVQRIVGDIANLDLGQYCQATQQCICMSKHLCGPSCDLAISALEQVDSPLRPPFAFATCCHYLCRLDVFAGKEFWPQLGLNEEDFEVAVAVSQWYSLMKASDIQSDHHNDTNAGGGYTDFEKLIDIASAALKEQRSSSQYTMIPSEEFERNFSRGAKSKLGLDVKRLLDMLRVAKLQQLGYKAEIVLYTDRSIENRLLVGSISEVDSW
jgi:tRNA:m4X modification enzyme